MTIKITSLTIEDAAECFTLTTEIFFDHSSLHRALNTTLERYRAYLHSSFMAMVNEGLSILARNDQTGEVMGCMIVTDYARHLKAEPVEKGDYEDGDFAPLSAITHQLRKNYKKENALQPGQVILVDMAAIAPACGGRGIYQKMRQDVEENASAKGYHSVVGELSSAATQHVILDKMAHQKIAEIRFTDFAFNGRKPFAEISEPPSYILAEGKL